ncbi:TRAP transporter large permease, partial [Chloroflexota bacterium]
MFGSLATVFGAFLGLLFSGMWVATLAALVGMGLLYNDTGWSNMLQSSGWLAWGGSTSFTLVTVPLFVLMGLLLMESGLGKVVYRAAAPLLNHFPGGLLYTNIIAGALFAACSGSPTASAATIGSVALPEMERRGYPFGMSVGSVGAGSILASIIPPSTMLIFYASIVEISIGKAFIAGIIPGMILTAMFILYITVRFRFYRGWKKIRGELLPWKTSLAKTRESWLIVVLIVMVLGSIFLGIATPTEAAAVGSSGAMLLTLLYRRLNWQVLRQATFGTMRITCQIMFIYVGIKIFSAALARVGIISYTTKVLLDLPVPPLAILLIVFGAFLILGFLIEGLPMMLMVVPVVFPAIVALGYDPLWFGIAVLLLCFVGNFTPPVGLTLFVLQSILPKRSLTEIYKGLIPFTIIVLFFLAIITV